ncbi:MAG TPA: SDR family NAD(P)-dependent oxidoreductase, partial [Spirochaetia bacterium]|nr:SDR family NAD(P)-dependent oxidoreductase [Spirochaetia bacterium]
MGMIQELRELVKITNYYGRDPEFVLAGGGNTSFKEGGTLAVKASGKRMADITEEGFVRLSREKLAGIWQKSYVGNPDERDEQVVRDIMEARLKGEELKRPSVETLLHELFGQPFVVHTHPSLVNGLTCASSGAQAAEELLGDRAVWVPVTQPGYALAVSTGAKMEEYRVKHGREPEVLLIQNHGLVVAGESFEDIRKRTGSVIQSIRTRIKRTPELEPVAFDRERASLICPALRMVLKGRGASSIVVFHTDAEIRRLVQSLEAFHPVSSAFTPDQIVYCGPSPLFIPYHRDLEEQYKALARSVRDFEKRRSVAPRLVAVEKLGVFAWGLSKRDADTTLAVFRDAVKIAAYSETFGGPLFMPGQLFGFIESWEAERFRKKVERGSGIQGRTREKIAVVTGGAQGFGLGLAEALAEQGANVILADINSELAGGEARRLSGRYGEGKVLPVGTDVRD